MGEVWLATATGAGGFAKQVVIKTILPDRADDPAFIEMLANEARVCAGLSHPNLIEVFDFLEHEGTYVIAMEHVVGRSLSQIVRASRVADKTLPPEFILRLIWECARGLECAHDQGIIHCDLSPSNIMVSFAGITKILDFGVAHSNVGERRASRLKGKYHYMAPERITSLATDRRTDVYAIGVILYLLFTGRLPFTADSDELLLTKIVKESPRPPSSLCKIDSRIEALIMRAMAKDPAMRFQTFGSLLKAVSSCMESRPSTHSQLDVAFFVCSLFPNAADLPPSIRAMLEGRPETISDEETQRRISLLMAESALVELESVDIDVVVENSSDGPSSAFVLRGASPAAAMTPTPTAKAPPIDPATPTPPPDESLRFVQRLYEPRGRPSSPFEPSLSRTFDSNPRLARGSDNLPEHLQPERKSEADMWATRKVDATGDIWEMRSEPSAVPPLNEAEPVPTSDRSSGVFGDGARPSSPSSSSRGVFDGYGSSRRAPAQEVWPWPASSVKPK